MTEPDLRDLLTELADAVEAPDLASTAWNRCERRRRRRIAVGAGVVAAAVAVGLGTAELRDKAVAPTHQSPSTPDGTDSVGPMLHGFSIAVAPRLADEASLPSEPSPLPTTIDLSRPNPSVLDQPLPSAVAAFGIQKIVGDTTHFDGVMLVGASGELRHLDAGRLQYIDTGDGNRFDPFTTGSLSPDGTRLAFPQPDGVAIFRIATGQWTEFPLSATSDDLRDLHWTADGLIRLGLTTLDPQSGQTTRDRFGSPLYGAGLEVQSWRGTERTLGDHHARAVSYLDERGPGGAVDAYPPAIVAAGGGVESLLLIPDQEPRWKWCCSVAGWLDANTVAYEATASRDPLHPTQNSRVLGWDISSGEVSLAATITGSSDMLFVGSYADLAR